MNIRDFLSRTLSRPPFADFPSTSILPRFLSFTPVHAMYAGEPDSGIMLSMLDGVGATASAIPQKLCGVIVGLPFDGLVRTLNNVGFDTENRLVSFSARRRRHLLRDAAGNLLSLSESEAAILPPANRPVPGQTFVPDDRLHFVGANGFLPAKLFCEDVAEDEPPGFECLSPELSPEENLLRIRHLDTIGNNAALFLHDVLRLIHLSGQRADTPTLRRLTLDKLERLEALKHAERHVRIACSDHDKATFLELAERMRSPAPPSAGKIVEEFYAGTIRGRRLVAPEELLRPGAILHFDGDSHAGACMAYAVKDTMQRAFLQKTTRGDLLLLLVAHDWFALAHEEHDRACVEHPDAMLLLGVARAEPLLHPAGAATLDLLRKTRVHFWHRMLDARSAELFRALGDDTSDFRKKFRDIEWGMALGIAGERFSLKRVPRDRDEVLYKDLITRHPFDDGSGRRKGA